MTQPIRPRTSSHILVTAISSALFAIFAKIYFFPMVTDVFRGPTIILTHGTQNLQNSMQAIPNDQFPTNETIERLLKNYESSPSTSPSFDRRVRPQQNDSSNRLFLLENRTENLERQLISITRHSINSPLERPDAWWISVIMGALTIIVTTALAHTTKWTMDQFLPTSDEVKLYAKNWLGKPAERLKRS